MPACARFVPVGVFVALLCTPLAHTQQHPRDREIHDADTRAWWHTTEELSNDSMEGRDTGSAAYQHAADYVAKRFASAGLQPAGDHGTYFQSVPMHEIDVTPEGTSFVVHRAGAPDLPLGFLQEITTTPAAGAAQSVAGNLTFRGYCGSDAMNDVAGKVVICFGTQREGLPGGAERMGNARKGHAAAVITVDDPYFTIEPPRWPYAYARSVTLRPELKAQVLQGQAAAEALAAAKRNRDNAQVRAEFEPQPLSFRLSDEAFTKLLAHTGHDAAAILKTGGAKQPLEGFDLPGFSFEARIHTAARDISSPNVLAVLPGTDAVLKDQYVVVAAHLDGYGFGTPVQGDNLYNGTLDDAAYVALLIQMAENLRDGRQRKAIEAVGINTGHYDGITMAAPKRSILFCAFTGEEKGLLGSNYFVQHPTVPIANMAADINLDQLRPLFPLKILTALAIHDTTLGQTAIEVGKGEGIEVREDREPERGLLRRADHYPFLRAGVPAIGFIFGFDPNTEAEQRYRHWYQVQYHRPQDDLTQPMDFQAALKFDVFFYRLVETVADSPERPRMLPTAHF
jgi:hypothetical protein